MPQVEELMSTARAASLLGKTRMHVRYLIRSGQLSAKHKGNLWMVSRRSVEELKARDEVD